MTTAEAIARIRAMLARTHYRIIEKHDRKLGSTELYCPDIKELEDELSRLCDALEVAERALEQYAEHERDVQMHTRVVCGSPAAEARAAVERILNEK